MSFPDQRGMLFILIAFLFLSGCSSTWTSADTRYEIIYQVVNAADAYTTMQIRRSPDVTEGAWLTRQLIGANPAKQDVALLFATYGISHYLIAKSLPAKWRRYYQAGTVGYSSALVINNCQLGLCK